MMAMKPLLPHQDSFSARLSVLLSVLSITPLGVRTRDMEHDHKGDHVPYGVVFWGGLTQDNKI